MAILFTIVGLLLIIAGGVGIVITNMNFPPATLDWINGNLTYGMFTILGIASIAVIIMTPRET